MSTKWDYEVPEVSWIKTADGYAPDPPFGLTWPHLQTLRHHAALIKQRTGLMVLVAPADDDEELFEIATRTTLRSGQPYLEASSYLSAFEIGANEGSARQAASLPAP